MNKLHDVTIGSLEELLNLIRKKAFLLLEYYKMYNQPFNIIDSVDNEMLHACMYNTMCTGSGGSGWDTLDKGESKGSDRCQSRKCLDCKAKVMFFLDVCPECNSGNLKDIADSRWGISSTSHLKYQGQLKSYRLTLVEPEENNFSCKKFRLRVWSIDADNEHLMAYAEGQNKQKSKGINFMPLSESFYMSKPCLHLDAILPIRGKVKINYFDPENNVPVDLPKKYSRTTEEVMQAKTWGKDRGNVTRRK